MSTFWTAGFEEASKGLGVGQIDIKVNTFWPQLSEISSSVGRDDVYIIISNHFRRECQGSWEEGDKTQGKTSNEPSTLWYHGSFEALDLGLNGGEGFEDLVMRRKAFWGQGQLRQICTAREAWNWRESSKTGKKREPPGWKGPLRSHCRGPPRPGK